ncbi:MAG: MarC family protein, partial [Pseudomonadota bacterium]|nr:MarC family protein [Pseudomonadota bacterium]
MELALATKLFAALFAIMNPLTNLPIFLSLTDGRTPRERSAIALTGAVTTFVILVVTLVAGSHILDFFDITVDDFRISGGLLILLIALAMLHARPSRSHHVSEEADAGRDKDNPGIFPLAMPLLA